MYLSFILVYVRDFDTDILSDFEVFVRIADISVNDLRDMDKPIVLESDIDKSPECNYIAHDTIEDISDSYGFERELLGTHHGSTLSTWIMTDGFI